MGDVGGDGLEDAIGVNAADTETLEELFEEEKVVEGFICRKCGLMGECSVGLGDRENADIDEIGDEEVSGSGASEDQFGGGDTKGDLKAELLRRSDTRSVDDVVTAAFNDVEGVRIGLASMLTEVKKDLLGDAGESTKRGGGDGTCDMSSAKGIVGATGERRKHGNVSCACDVIDPYWAVGEAVIEVRCCG